MHVGCGGGGKDIKDFKFQRVFVKLLLIPSL